MTDDNEITELNSRQLVNIRDMVMRIDQNVINMSARAAEDRTKADALDKRVDKLENWQSRIGGIAIGLSAIVGVLVGFAKDAIAAVLNHFN